MDRRGAGTNLVLRGLRRRDPHHALFRVAPMVVNRVVVGAHYGLGNFIAQRVTAVIMAVYSLIMLVVVMGGRPLSYAVWKDLFTQGWMRVATLLFAISLAWHAWIGAKEILIAYARPDSLRFALHVIFALIIAAYLGWTIQILWR